MAAAELATAMVVALELETVGVLVTGQDTAMAMVPAMVGATLVTVDRGTDA